MAKIAYYRVSTHDQSIKAQQHALLVAAGSSGFDKEFKDEGVSGGVPAPDRPGFAALLAYVREGDVVFVAAVDRLGRDALDVQATVRRLIDRKVVVHVLGLGNLGKGAGELVLAVLAQIADMERERIKERTAAGRGKAREALASTGQTHRGKLSLGRPVGRVAGGLHVNPAAVAAWRRAQGASIAATAKHWKLSEATVKRYCALHGSQARP